MPYFVGGPKDGQFTKSTENFLKAHAAPLPPLSVLDVSHLELLPTPNYTIYQLFPFYKNGHKVYVYVLEAAVQNEKHSQHGAILSEIQKALFGA